MGIQINGVTDSISAVDGSLSLTGAELASVGGINVSGIVTATTFIGNLTGNVYAGIVTATSSVVVSAGTTAAPSITPTGDSNTGIFFPSADTIAFAEGGSEAMRIDSSGRLGIGTNAPIAATHIMLSDVTGFSSPANDGLVVERGGGNDLGITIATDNTRNGYLIFADGDSANPAWVGYDHSANAMSFRVNASERARIDSSGRLLVGTSTARSNFFGTTLSSITQTEGTGGAGGRGALSVINNDVSNNPPYVLLGRSGAATLGSNAAVVSGSRLGTLTFHGADGTSFIEAATVGGEVDGTPGTNDMPGRLVFSTTADGASSPTERMKLDRNGVITLGLDGVRFCVFRPSGSFAFRGGDVGDGFIRCEDPSANAKFTVSSAGNGVFAGSLSKGSGSFKISHPLPEKTNTHYLVHSFIEGPQADLIYRGHIGLVDGTAQVNIDKAGRMTEGTFEALCTNVCCFTSNETDWTPVRGHVDGNILTIEAQDPTSTAKVCWMVIGERKDQHMLDTDWTDKDGRVITEPLKDVVTPEAA